MIQVSIYSRLLVFLFCVGFCYATDEALRDLPLSSPNRASVEQRDPAWETVKNMYKNENYSDALRFLERAKYDEPRFQFAAGCCCLKIPQKRTPSFEKSLCLCDAICCCECFGLFKNPFTWFCTHACCCCCFSFGEEAVAHFQKAVSCFEGTERVERQSKYYNYSMYNLGLIYARGMYGIKRNLLLAVKMFEGVKDARARADADDAKCNLGVCLYQLGRHDEAQRYFENLSRDDRSEITTEATFNLGLLLLQKSQPDYGVVRDVFLRAINSSDQFSGDIAVISLVLLGLLFEHDLLQEDDNFAEAERYYEQAIDKTHGGALAGLKVQYNKHVLLESRDPIDPRDTVPWNGTHERYETYGFDYLVNLRGKKGCCSCCYKKSSFPKVNMKFRKLKTLWVLL